VVYLLAVFALVVPIVLVVQSIRGRVRLQCCAVEPGRDARMAGGLAAERTEVRPTTARVK
jgi:hypothetical protein